MGRRTFFSWFPLRARLPLLVSVNNCAVANMLAPILKRKATPDR